MKFTSKSGAETEAFAVQFAEKIIQSRQKPDRKENTAGATVVGLYGNLGSGKTAFTQALARALGVTETLTSPTFVVEKIYPLFPSLSQDLSTGFTHLVHIDAYRIDNFSEMKSLGWDETVRNPSNLVVIEWPERLAELLPADHIRLQFTFIDETTREIEEVVQ